MKRQPAKAKTDTKRSRGVTQKTKANGRIAARSGARGKSGTGSMLGNPETRIRKAAVAIGTVLGKAMGRMEKALK